MRRLIFRLERGAMFALAFMPLCAVGTRLLTNAEFFGCVWFSAQTLLIALISLLPLYVGSYLETEQIVLEGGANRGNDPNPDRESRHETVRTGRRFALRVPVYVLFALAHIALLTFAPDSIFVNERFLFRFVFIVVLLIPQIIIMATVPSDDCVWTSIPGIALGFAVYLGSAIYMQSSKADNARLGTLLGVCAIAFLFISGICLNRQSIRFARDDFDHRPPRAVTRRSRNIVLIFMTAITLISFIGPIREGVYYIVKQLLAFLKSLSGKRSEPETYGGGLMQMLEYATNGEAPVQVTPETPSNDTAEKVLVYVFFGMLALMFIWTIISLEKRLNEFISRERTDSDGYYDEKEDLKKKGESRVSRKDLAQRLKQLLSRETPWEKLSGREKARRLVRDIYKKQYRRVRNVRSRTVNEALSQMGVSNEQAKQTGEAYDTARYSSQEVDTDKMDELRKGIKP